MKKYFKNKLTLLAALVVFACAGIAVSCVINPDTVEKVASATAMAGFIPFTMIRRKGPGRLFKTKAEDEQDDDDDSGNSGEAAEKRLMAKIKGQIDEVTADYRKRLKTLESSSREYEELKTRLEGIETIKDNLKEHKDIKKLIDEFAEVSLKVKGLEDKIAGGAGDKKTIKAQINAFIEKNFDKIKNTFRGGGFVEIELKAADVMVTTSASNPDGIPELVGVQMAPPTNVNLREAIVDQLITTLATSLAAYPYTESLPKDGNFAFVLEKGNKPAIDFKIETRYAEPKKVAAHMRLSEESVTDIPGLQSIANDYLRKKHNLKRQRGILFGDGIGANPKGATEYGRIFTAGAMAGKVTDPNMMDVINAAVTDIFTTHNFTDETPYMANIAMINPMDFFTEIVAAKDDNGLPLYPMASLFNRVVMGGVLVIPFEDIPSGKIFVADLSKYNVTNYVPYSVRIGWINDDFIKNIFCIVGESRFHAFVRKLDEQAFIYDDIANIKGLLDGSMSS